MSGQKGKGKKSPKKDGLFDDLEALSNSEIAEQTEAMKASSRATQEEIKRLQQERQSQISLVQSLRTIQESTRGIGKERNTLLNQFRAIRDESVKKKALRDEINQNVPPPLEIIEQRLVETHRRLSTIPNDLSKMPNRDHEVKLFSFFFELQAMHAKKKVGNELHQQYIELLRKQKEKLNQLDKLNDEKKSVAEDARKEAPGQKANPKEIRKLNERISEMLESINQHRAESKKLRREIGRFEAYIRVRKKSSQKGRRSGKVGPRLEDLKSRASSGGVLSMEDFSAILNSGGLDALSGNKEEKKAVKEETKKPRRRQVGAARGRRRTLNTDEREKRSR
jgi:DNA repair exonuclease SbcCD ATPase subunit